MYVTRKRTAFLIGIIIVFLAACGPSHPSEATATVTAPETPLPPPQPLDLGVFGKGSASSIEWSPDGKMLAVESSAGGYIYDTTGWQLLASIPTESLENNQLSRLTFFPDNQNLLFVAGLVTNNVYHSVFWRYNLRTGTISRVFENIGEAPYQKPFFSPDGKLLVLDSSSCTSTESERMCKDILELYDAVTGGLIRRIPENGLDRWEDMSVFAFSPDSQLIAAGGEDDVIRMWDVASGTLKYKLQHESDIYSLSFSPDGSVLVSSGGDAAVRFWDTKSGKSLHALHGSLDTMFQNAAYIDGGKRLLVNYYDGKFKEYSLDEHYLPIGPLDVLMETEERFMTQMGRYTPELVMHFSPDGHTMALVVNANVQIWDLQTGKKTLTLPEFNREVFSMEFSPDGNLLAMADHNVHLWQVYPKKFIGSLEINGDQITDIAFNPDGTKAAFASIRKDAQVWDITTLRKGLTLETECRTSHLAYSPDGKKLAAAGQCGIELFDAGTGALLDKFPNDLGTPEKISFSADGNLLLFVSDNGRRAWNLTTGKQIYSIKRIDDYMGNVALRPNLLAITKWQAPIYFFDPIYGKRLYEFPPGEGSNVIALSSNGHLLALDNYSKISVLDSTSGAELLSVKFRLPYTLSFSPDDRLLAARSYEEVAHLWDISSAAQYAAQTPPQTATPNPALTPTLQPTETPAPTLSVLIPTAPSLAPGDMQYDRVAQMEKLGELGLGHMRVMSWSPNGKTLALGGYSGAYTFEFGSSQPAHFFPANNAIVLLAFSSDGNYLAGQLSNEAIIVWDARTGQTLHRLQDIGCWNQGMEFISHNELLNADCGDLLYTWDVAGGFLVSKETKKISDAASSEKFTVETGMKNTRLIDAQTGEIVKTFEIPGMAPAVSIFSPDGKTLAVWHYQYEIARTGVYFPGQEHKTVVQLWNILPDEPPTLRAELSAGKWYQEMLILEVFQGISFSSDSRMLATASGDGTTQIWEVNSGRLLYTLPDGHNIYFSPDGKYLASLDNDQARVWDVSSRQPAVVWEISGFDRYSYSLVFGKNGSELVSVTDEAYKFFTLSGTTLTGPSRQIELPGVSGHNMSISPDGSRLAYSTAEQIVVGENNLQGPHWQILSKFAEPLAYDRDLDLTFSPAGSLLASYDPDNKIRLWNLEDLTSVELASNTFVSEFLFNPDGTLLLGTDSHTSDPSTLYLWDTYNGKLVRKWTSQIYQLAFHPRKPILIGADYMTGLIRFFDLRTGDVIKEIRADQYIRDLTFSPDGNLLALGYDTKFEIRDPETLTLLKEIPIHPNFLAVSPDGSMLAISLTDGRIEYWGWR